MLENWIIADWELIGNIQEKPEVTDSLNGASEIKKNLGSYGKTTDGVKLFLKANPTKVYNNSPSFKRFVDSLEDIDCFYTDFDK